MAVRTCCTCPHHRASLASCRTRPAPCVPATPAPARRAAAGRPPRPLPCRLNGGQEGQVGRQNSAAGRLGCKGAVPRASEGGRPAGRQAGPALAPIKLHSTPCRWLQIGPACAAGAGSVPPPTHPPAAAAGMHQQSANRLVPDSGAAASRLFVRCTTGSTSSAPMGLARLSCSVFSMPLRPAKRIKPIRVKADAGWQLAGRVALRGMQAGWLPLCTAARVAPAWQPARHAGTARCRAACACRQAGPRCAAHPTSRPPRPPPPPPAPVGGQSC